MHCMPLRNSLYVINLLSFAAKIIGYKYIIEQAVNVSANESVNTIENLWKQSFFLPFVARLSVFDCTGNSWFACVTFR